MSYLAPSTAITRLTNPGRRLYHSGSKNDSDSAASLSDNMDLFSTRTKFFHSQCRTSFNSSPLFAYKPSFRWVFIALCISVQSAALGVEGMELRLNDIQSYLNSLDGSHSNSNTEPVSLMWGIGDTTAFVGRMFTYAIPSDAFKGSIQSFKVSAALEIGLLFHVLWNLYK